MLEVRLDQPAVLIQFVVCSAELFAGELSLVLNHLGGGREEPASHSTTEVNAVL